MEIKSRKMSHPSTSRRLQRSSPLGTIALFPRFHFSQVMMCFILFQYFFMMVELQLSGCSSLSSVSILTPAPWARSDRTTLCRSIWSYICQPRCSLKHQKVNVLDVGLGSVSLMLHHCLSPKSPRSSPPTNPTKSKTTEKSSKSRSSRCWLIVW